MKIAPSTYYYKPKRSPEEEAYEAKLKARIEEIVKEFPGYGYRRVTKKLNRECCVNHKKIERLMQEMELQCKQPRSYKVTTNSNHRFPRYPNLIKGIVPATLNQIWVADITYIGLARGYVYLAAILDLFSRKVIGYALSPWGQVLYSNIHYIVLQHILFAFDVPYCLPCIIIIVEI